MKNLTLGDLCGITSKERGFYITDLKDKVELFFESSDDFYEKSFAKQLMKRKVIFIDVKENRLNIIVK